ncbi:MAG TPA: TetR/AcrR family transcriptional regulator [Anaerolineales bacterium]|jgi:AcrR family transcriptional regulator|nr:TetR/AcrR family transcriptional regulator [Anaerolineales bacterium]
MVTEAPTKGERTRQAIEEAAFGLFMEQGYHATSMRQIADKAGLALGGIYNHYSNKDEIFQDIVEARHPYRHILPAILAAQGGTAEEFIRNAAQALVQGLGKEPDLLKLMFIEIVEFNGKHMTFLLNQIAPKLLPVFEKLVKVRKNLRSIPPPVLMRSFLGLFFSYYITELFLKNTSLKKLMPKNSFDLMVDIYLHGVIKEPA